MQHYTLDLIRTRVGFGVVSDVAIPNDAFIIEYVGEVLLGPDVLERSDRCYQVCMKTKANWDGAKNIFIDAARCGNESRCINRSCKLNCALYELEWTNTSRLGIYAKTDIPPLQAIFCCVRGIILNQMT
ncbi:Histone-lysine N-methyltransferase [Phytophthora citrophthora]|uniref:Histone-lysine N-methyltransferase n=1 Tax=Phytophthora citrophthora TaxID=4793 RepID=A0AAD9GB98_9STRA|nr:Histone-lysine N-methyltransferase [Phytophthora citrophthora]